MRSVYELTTEEAYRIVAEHFGHELPPLDAVENEDWGRDYVLQHFQRHSEDEQAGAGAGHQHPRRGRPVALQRVPQRLLPPASTERSPDASPRARLHTSLPTFSSASSASCAKRVALSRTSDRRRRPVCGSR